MDTAHRHGLSFRGEKLKFVTRGITMDINHRTLRFLQHGPDRIRNLSPVFLAKSVGVNPEGFTSSLWMGLIQ
jgi:hypothetical protein